MNVAPVQPAPQGTNNHLAPSTPTAQLKVPASAQTAAASPPNSVESADAITRAETSSQPDLSSSTAPKQGSEEQASARGGKIDMIV